MADANSSITYLPEANNTVTDQPRFLAMPEPGTFTFLCHEHGDREEAVLSFNDIKALARTIKVLMRRASASTRNEFRRFCRGGIHLRKSGELTGAAIRALRAAEDAMANRPQVPGIYQTPDDFAQWLFEKLAKGKVATVEETLLILSIFFLLTYLILKRQPTAFTNIELHPEGFVEANLKAVLIVTRPDQFLTTADIVGLAYAADIERELLTCDALLTTAEAESSTPTQTASAITERSQAAMSDAQAAIDRQLATEIEQTPEARGDKALISQQVRRMAARSEQGTRTKMHDSKVRVSASVMVRQVRYVLNKIGANLHMSTVFSTQLEQAVMHMWLTLTGRHHAIAMADPSFREHISELMRYANLVEAMYLAYGGQKVDPLTSVDLANLLLTLEKVVKAMAVAHDGVKRRPAADIHGGVGLRKSTALDDAAPSLIAWYKLAGAPAAPLCFIPGQTDQAAFFTAQPSEWARTVSDHAAAWSALFNPVLALGMAANARVGDHGYTVLLSDLTLREKFYVTLGRTQMRVQNSKSGAFDLVFQVDRRVASGSEDERRKSALALRAEEAVFGVRAREYMVSHGMSTDVDRMLYIPDVHRTLALHQSTWSASGTWPARVALKPEYVDGARWLATASGIARYMHTSAKWRETLNTSAGPRTAVYELDLNLAHDSRIEAAHTMVVTKDEFARQRAIGVWWQHEAYQMLLASNVDKADVRLYLAPTIRALLSRGGACVEKARAIVQDLCGTTRVLSLVAGRAAALRIQMNAQFQYGRVLALVGLADLAAINRLDVEIFRHLASMEASNG
jgi:hypothetical protein